MGLVDRVLQRNAQAAKPSAHPGCIAIVDAPLGRVVRIHGDITSVILRPTTTTRALEAEIDDGSARLVIVWLGRSAIRGVEPGRGITIEGRVVRMEDKFMMHNPRYELAPRGALE
jgi:hypothetical protein